MLDTLAAQVSRLTDEVQKLSADLAQHKVENAVLKEQCADLTMKLRDAQAQGPATKSTKRTHSAGARAPATPSRAVRDEDMLRSPEAQHDAPARRLEDGFPHSDDC